MMRRLLLLSILLAGCAREATPPAADGPDAALLHGGLEYTADTRVMESFPVQLATTVTIANRGSAPVTLTLPDGCAVLLRAFRSATGTVPAYDALHNVVCTLALQEVTIPPGGREQFSTRSDAREILGDSLSDGTYWLRALVRPNGGEVEVPAGEVQLAVPR